MRGKLVDEMQAGHFDRAIRLVKRAQERHCADSASLSDLAEEARAALTAVQQRPADAIREGLALHASGQFAKARMLFDSALLRIEANEGPPRIVEVPTSDESTGYSEKRSTIELLRFSLDGRYLVLTGGTRFQALFDLQSNAPPFIGAPEYQAYTSTKSMAISPDGMLIAYREDNAAMLYSTQTGKPTSSLFGHEKNSDYSEALDSVAFFWDNRHVATGDEKGTMRIFDKGKSSALAETKSLRDELQAIAVSPDGRFVASAFEGESAVRIRALRGGATYAILTTETDGVTDLVWTANGRYLTASALFGSIDIWDLGACRRLTIRDKPPCHQYSDGSCGYPAMFGMSMSSDGAYVAAAFDEAGVYLWDGFSGKRLAVLPVKAIDHAWSVAFSHDGKLLAAGSVLGTSMYRITGNPKRPVEPLLWISLNKSRDTDGYALDRTADGYYDAYGAGARRLACRIGKEAVPLVVCEDRMRVKGLVGLRARGLAADPLDVEEKP